MNLRDFGRWTGGGQGKGTAVRVGAFGKSPQNADFLYYGPVDAEVQAFRLWLDEGVGWASTRQPGFWRAAADDMRVFAFVFRAGSGNLLVGALRPSIDSVGRHFPISVYFDLPVAGLSENPQALLLAFGDWWQRAAEAVLATDPLRAVTALEAEVAPGAPLSLLSVDQDAREYAAWAESTPLPVALTAVFGFDARGSLFEAVYTIYAAILPFRGQERPTTPLSVRVPLGGSGAAAAAFWVDLIRHAAGWKKTVPSLFWSFQGDSGEAIIQLGEVPSSTLSALWLPDPKSDHMCDLTQLGAGDASRFLPLLPALVAQALTRDGARVIDLLNALQS